MTPIDNVYTKKEVDALIDAAVAEARAIDEASMAEHNFKATIIKNFRYHPTLYGLGCKRNRQYCRRS